MSNWKDLTLIETNKLLAIYIEDRYLSMHSVTRQYCSDLNGLEYMGNLVSKSNKDFLINAQAPLISIYDLHPLFSVWVGI